MMFSLTGFVRLRQILRKLLHCWLYVFVAAMEKKISIEDEITMTPQLQDFVKRDTGFKQYKQAVADPQARDDYFRWLDDKKDAH
jgi:hypothetical protein